MEEIRKAVMVGMIATMNAFILCGQIPDGSYRGDLKIGGTELRLVLNLDSAKNQCTLDSPQQGAFGIPCEVDTIGQDTLAVTVPSIGASYSAVYVGGSLEGTFKQMGRRFPLKLLARNPAVLSKPDFIERDTVFVAKDGVKLAGTITLPTMQKTGFPMVVMVTGSGPQDRDESIMGHKPFAAIAHGLAGKGIASLRYDDRGVALSEGDFASATTDTFTEDALAALKCARDVKSTGKVGVLGHSEGGTIATMVGARKEADFVISLAGMAVTGKETLIDQNRRALRKADLAEEIQMDALRLISALLDSVAAGSRNVDVQALSRRLGCKEIPTPLMANIAKSSTLGSNPWVVRFIQLDPSEWLRDVNCPVLAINGGLDTQVDADANLAVFQHEIPSASIMKLDGINHLMQHATTGSFEEYGEIEDDLAPEVLEAIAEWVLKLSE